MNLNDVMLGLYEKLGKLNQAIAAVEEFERTRTLAAPRRAGRKSMGKPEMAAGLAAHEEVLGRQARGDLNRR